MLTAWFVQNQKAPTNVLYYRDGVSSSQYTQLVKGELSAFQKAFEDFAGKRPPTESKTIKSIKVTTVIVTKRHNTRFFPTQSEDAMKGNENCFPGTLVDSVVTSSYYGDFYLQTQNAIKGTARPCHYFVIKNDMNIPIPKLQELVSVSIAKSLKLY